METSGIGKRLRLRISRVLGRPKDPPSAAVPPAFCVSPRNPKSIDIDFPPPRAATARLRLAPVVSAGFCCNPRRLSRCTPTPSLPHETPTATYTWHKSPNYHVIAAAAADIPRRKIDSEDSRIVLRLRRRKAAEARRRSTSSGDSGWFSSEEEDDDGDEVEEGEETETLLSSFEADSSDAKRGTCYPSPDTASPPDQVVVAESFAVVKRSEDPKEDFRRSMAEMVLEKEIYGEAGLEQLLHCFLSLNSRIHHPAIVAAFADIWDAIFPVSHAVN